MMRLARWSYRLGRWVVILTSLAIFHLLPYLLILRFAMGFGAFTSPIADAIGQRLGVRASLDDSIVQYRSQSTLVGLRLYEDGQDEPFLVAGHVETDFNVVQYLRGHPIRRIDLSDVEVRLRFDSAGRPLTSLSPPAASGGARARIPALRVRNGRLTIAQEGRQPFTLDGVSLTLEPGKRYELFGII